MEFSSTDPRTKGRIHFAFFESVYLPIVQCYDWKVKDGDFVANDGVTLKRLFVAVHNSGSYRKEPNECFCKYNFTKTPLPKTFTPFTVEQGKVMGQRMKERYKVVNFPKMPWKSRKEWVELDIKIRHDETVKIKVNKWLVHHVPNRMRMGYNGLHLIPDKTHRNYNHFIYKKRLGKALSYILVQASGLECNCARTDKFDYRMDDEGFVAGKRIVNIWTRSVDDTCDKLIIRNTNGHEKHCLCDRKFDEYKWFWDERNDLVYTYDDDTGEKISLAVYVVEKVNGVMIRDIYVPPSLRKGYKRAIDENDLRKRAKYENAALGSVKLYTRAKYFKRRLLFTEKITKSGEVDFRLDAIRIGGKHAATSKSSTEITSVQGEGS